MEVFSSWAQRYLRTLSNLRTNGEKFVNAYDVSRDLPTVVYTRQGDHADLYHLSQNSSIALLPKP
jgi:hypothetical protein